jgi:hypothetical protein
LGDFDPWIDDFSKDNEILMTSDGKKYRKYEKGFSLDANRGLVRFSEAVTQKWDEDAQKAWDSTTGTRSGKALRYKPPKLFLRVAFGVREKKDMTWTRYARERDVTGNTTPGTLPYYVRREDVVRRVFFDYSVSASMPVDNETALHPIADFYIQQYLDSIQVLAPFTRRYAGLKLIVIDGTIQQTTWAVDSAGYTTTTASFNQEAMTPDMTWAEKENRQKAELLFDENSLFTGGTRNSLVSEL